MYQALVDHQAARAKYTPITQSGSARKHCECPHFQDYAPLHACRKSPNGQRHAQSSSTPRKSDSCTAIRSNDQLHSFPVRSIIADNDDGVQKATTTKPIGAFPYCSSTSTHRATAYNSIHHHKQNPAPNLCNNTAPEGRRRRRGDLPTR